MQMWKEKTSTSCTCALAAELAVLFTTCPLMSFSL